MPIVRRVGGLADTVRDAGVAAPAAEGNGFVFDAPNRWRCRTPCHAPSMPTGKPEAWARLMQRGMAEDLSWDGPARDYMALYGQACRDRRDTRPRDTD